MDPTEAQSRAEETLPDIRKLANRLLRAGQRPTIERDDLIGVGCLSVVRDLKRNPRSPKTHLLRNAKTLMIQSITREVSHWQGRKPWAEMFDEDGDAQF